MSDPIALLCEALELREDQVAAIRQLFEHFADDAHAEQPAHLRHIVESVQLLG